MHKAYPGNRSKNLSNIYQNDSCSKQSMSLSFLESIAAKFSNDFDVCEHFTDEFSFAFAKVSTRKDFYPRDFFRLNYFSDFEM